MIALDLRPALTLTDDAFAQLCRSNPDLRLERTARGKLIAMSPASSDSSNRNADIIGQLWQFRACTTCQTATNPRQVRSESV